MMYGSLYERRTTISTDAPIEGGNSGGRLFDADWQINCNKLCR